ncbi:hypothetical protein Sste5346_009682 [Sporothrix stenoceras]|uniref:C6 zinc finger domain containing protein n=1 Tax=Sporothrix stenoceras TaxID=5173 RepID=A0ABR3YJT2_9PEZI
MPPTQAQAQAQTQDKPQSQALSRQPSAFNHDAGLDFFHHHIAASLNGQLGSGFVSGLGSGFGSGFWGRLVLQLAHMEPCIRHAVAAVSIVHQDVQLSLRNPAGYVTANQKAQQQWEMAAKSLSKRIREQPDSHMVPLVCCLLFTFIEFLRGHAQMAMLHVENGLRILAAHRRQRASAITNGIDSNAVEETILPIFSRLNVLSSLTGRMTPPAYAGKADEGDDRTEFEDLADAELCLVAILDTCIRFIGTSACKAEHFCIQMDDLLEQVRLQVQLDTWHEQLDKLLRRMKAAGKSTEQSANAVHLLSVHYLTVYVWLRVCTTAGEMATDAYVADFEKLVQHAEHVIKPVAAKEAADGKTVQPPLVSFDIQILGPLYFTAMKCRDAGIRRRALAMLQYAPRREGLWNAHVAHATAKRVIEFEESKLDEQGWPHETVRVHGLPLPDDESRVTGKEIDVTSSYLVLSPAFPAMLETEFKTKPWGVAGEWHTTQEYIKPDVRIVE